MRTHLGLTLGLGLMALATAGLGAATDTPRAAADAVRVSFTTRPLAGKYSPRHVLAVWVTDADGKFVKTLLLMANRQKRRLAAWQGSANGNATDAVTGATLKSHQTHTVVWDGRSAAGAPAAMGNYRVHVEYTEANGPGPVSVIDIALGAAAAPPPPAAAGKLADLKVEYGAARAL